MTKQSVAVVTCYHFDNSNSNREAYERLLRSVRESLRQLEALGSNSRLVLVANGTDNGAMDPEEVIKGVKSKRASICEELVYPWRIKTNRQNTGGLNEGINEALHHIGNVEWIASVQSSAVIKEGWLSEVLAAASIDASVGGAFGRILVEEDLSLIWTDGHLLRKGLTYDANNRRRIEDERLRSPGQFPCLSACLFRRSLVESIWNAYGNFVCENLCHFGDCTDVSLRARTVEPSVQFKYSGTALALKRLPTQDPCKIAVSQLMAASLYYSQEQRTQREDSISKTARYSSCLGYARVEADRRISERYSPGSPTAPAGVLFDSVW